MRGPLVLLVILAFSSCVCNSQGWRRTRRPPSGFGRQSEYSQNQYGQEQDYGDIGQSQDFQSSNNQLEYGGLQQNQVNNEDDGDIQQVSRDTEDFSELLQQSSQNQVNVDDGIPPKYTEASSEIVTTKTRPEAITPKGTFIGLKKTINATDVYAFYAIPFAKPPVGNLRFRRPEAADKLTEPYDATHLPNACSQPVSDVFGDFPGEKVWYPNTNISEDCLYVNIWVPAKVFEKKEEELEPVIFWIYGGGYFSGSASLDVYDGAVIAATQGLVVVSPQYRLGPFGFLYLGVEDAPGNMGLIDQTLALKWTRENIEYFGGDPNAVTAAGESCGSASVGFHLVSPLSKSYFKRGIMTSGLPTAKYAFKSPDEAKSRSFQFAKHAGCKSKNPKEIIECLRDVDAETLTHLQWKVYKGLLDFPFSPTVDGYFLTDHPDNVLKKGNAKRAELVLGTVRDEGTYFIIYHYLNYFSNTKPTSVPYDRFVDILNEIFQDYSETEREAIIDEYTNWENPEDGHANQRLIGEAVGDAIFVCPHRKFADDWANRGLSVYYYHFTERFSNNPWAKWMGVMHGDDIPLFFGDAVTETSYSDGEKQMTQKFMSMVANFARMGIPSTKWERYTSEHPMYLEVNATVVTDASTHDQHGPRAEKCAFWNKFLPLLRSASEQCNNSPQSQSQQFGSLRQPQQQPQWNANGQGIHGGQGFQSDNLHNNEVQYQFIPNPTHQPHCGPPSPHMPMYFSPPPNYYPPPQFHSQQYNGCGAPLAAPSPTAQSCQCTVQETSTTSAGQEVDDFRTPRPE
uniref:Acetylcholinesterase n=1 Tax=Orchesella villosa TaxID=48706 RepID=B8XCX2_ORCVL|nr:acetylcholinesterase 2 [Orchesella villosa]